MLRTVSDNQLLKTVTTAVSKLAIAAVAGAAVSTLAAMTTNTASWAVKKVYACITVKPSRGLCVVLQQMAVSHDPTCRLRPMMVRDAFYRIKHSTFSGFVDIPAECLMLHTGPPSTRKYDNWDPRLAHEIKGEGALPPVHFHIRKKYLPCLWAFLDKTSTAVHPPSIIIPRTSSYFSVLEKFVQRRIAANSNVRAVAKNSITTNGMMCELVLHSVYKVTFPDGKDIYVQLSTAEKTSYEDPSFFELTLTYADKSDNVGTDIRARLMVSLESLHKEEDTAKSSVHLLQYGNPSLRSCKWWRVVDEVTPRPLNTVFLDGATKETVIHDIAEFQASRAWYASKCIPFRRGYLLHGPPGTGKTTFIRAIAQHFHLDICHVQFDSESDDTQLVHMFNSAPENSILVLEDVDRLFPATETAKAARPLTIGGSGLLTKQRGVVTMSGLMNALDNASAAACRIVFMTTNHIEVLDEALVRCGRCDLKVLVGYATRNQLEDMFSSFYPDATELSGVFGEALQNVPCLTIASVQEHFIKCKASAQDAVKRVNELVQTALIS